MSVNLGSLGSDTIESHPDHRVFIEIHKAVELLWDDTANRNRLTVRRVRELVEEKLQLAPGFLGKGDWRRKSQELIHNYAEELMNEHENEPMMSHGEGKKNAPASVRAFPLPQSQSQSFKVPERGVAFNVFHSFPKLPTELRLKVWQYAIPGMFAFGFSIVLEHVVGNAIGPRIIRVKAHYLKSHVSGSFMGLNFTSSTAVPAILHACRESRVEGLKTYQLGMKTHKFSPKVYVDFTKDTIYLRNVFEDASFTLDDLMRYMPSSELKKLKRLEIEQSLWEKNRFLNATSLLDLRRLKKLTMVVEKDGSINSREVQFEEPQETDATVFEFSDDSDYGSDDGSTNRLVWPRETEEFMMEMLEDIVSEHHCHISMPQIECKLLVSADGET